MTHVLTSSRLAYNGSLPSFSWPIYGQFLSWVQTDPAYAAGASSAGIKPYWYTNPNRQATTGNMYTTNETTFAHDCNNNRILDTQSNLYLMQPSSATLANLWLNVAQNELAKFPSYAAIFEDDTDDIYAVNATPCNYSATTWLSSSVTEAGVLAGAHLPVIYNALTFTGANGSVAPAIAMNQTTVGGMMEGCYIRPGLTNNQRNGLGWEAAENTEIQMAQQNKWFFCYADNYDLTAAQSIALRQYAYASFLLSYDPSTSIYETNFSNKNDFNVMPESGIVALQPLTAAPTSAVSLLTSGGAYGREYAACYLRGQYVGKCAAAVNSDAFHTHPFPFSGYTRTMVISGGDVLSGGTISTNGPAPASSIPVLTGVVAFK